MGQRHQQSGRMSFWLVFAACLGCVLGTNPLAHAQDADPPSKRWAIICSPDLELMGVSDLLTAKLSDMEDLVLVERDLIAKVNAETVRAGFSEPTNIKDRLKIGRQLSADFLAIISTQRLENRSILHMVVCECQLGTRISDDKAHLRFDSGEGKKAKVEDIVETCKFQILKTRKRFANGIQTVVGVAPFQSKTRASPEI